MSELNFYIKKLQDLEYRGEWKEIYYHSYEKIHSIIQNSHFLRRIYYLNELEKYHEIFIDFPFSPDDEEKLIFRRTQKHIIDLLYQIREENKKIFVAQGRNSGFSDKVSALLGRLKLDYISLDYGQATEKNIKEFNSVAKECEFAIIILSPDDWVKPADSSDQERLMSSQNVIFQFGYFLSHVGRKNLVLLYAENKEIYCPINFDDLKHAPLDSRGAWKGFLISKLIDAGIYLDPELKKNVI
jgi:hypothetical protein